MVTAEKISQMFSPADPTQLIDSDGDGWAIIKKGKNDRTLALFDAGVINGTKPDGTRHRLSNSIR
ncbi:MAG: hypothetical protein CM15mP9_4440 [Methanobacteriota archaeon]|nr:MAG: hypothetical protein CM15mP9_4440 [Euryarchaeota archaeon]